MIIEYFKKRIAMNKKVKEILTYRNSNYLNCDNIVDINHKFNYGNNYQFNDREMTIIISRVKKQILKYIMKDIL